MITLDDGTDIVELPGDLEWTDEYQWSAVAQEVEVTLTGAVIADESQRQAGRPITLQGDWVWIDRATVNALRALDVPGKTFTLTLEDARTFTCTWRRHDGLPLEARPVLYQSPSNDSDPYRITLRLMET